MFVARDTEGTLIWADEANKQTDYFCPVCSGKLILRAGEVNAHHFAHEAGACPDHWHYDMSDWHKTMQEQFPIECREVVMKHNGEIHRADVFKDGVVVEFQHSPITPQEFRERNTNGVPIVAISSGLDRYGQREELTHVLMYLLFSDINERILNNAVEYFLLPSEDIIQELGRKRKSLCAKEIRIIAEKYGVFEKCVVRRAKEEGIINRKWQNNIQNIIVDERKAELPTRLLQIVLRAYTEGETSISRAAELLQTDSSTAATTLKE